MSQAVGPTPPPLRFRRTLVDARREFEEQVLPRVSDHQARQGREMLEVAEGKARAEADKRVISIEAEVREIRDEALRELTEVRDSFDALASEASLGRISSAEYSNRLEALRRRQAEAEGQLDDAEEKVEQIAAVEDDPIRWYDDLTRRTNLLQEWPW
jgi:chromosome segregation ATPase